MENHTSLFWDIKDLMKFFFFSKFNDYYTETKDFSDSPIVFISIQLIHLEIEGFSEKISRLVLSESRLQLEHFDLSVTIFWLLNVVNVAESTESVQHIENNEECHLNILSPTPSIPPSPPIPRIHPSPCRPLAFLVNPGNSYVNLGW